MIRKVTERHKAEANKTPVYKAVREGKNGRLRSLFITGTKRKPERMGAGLYAVALTYKEDRVISNGELGIWCCPTLGEARSQAYDNGQRELCRIYEVLPIGEPIQQPLGWFGTLGAVLYPAIILGEYVETLDLR